MKHEPIPTGAKYVYELDIGYGFYTATVYNPNKRCLGYITKEDVHPLVIEEPPQDTKTAITMWNKSGEYCNTLYWSTYDNVWRLEDSKYSYKTLKAIMDKFPSHKFKVIRAGEESS